MVPGDGKKDWRLRFDKVWEGIHTFVNRSYLWEREPWPKPV